MTLVRSRRCISRVGRRLSTNERKSRLAARFVVKSGRSTVSWYRNLRSLDPSPCGLTLKNLLLLCCVSKCYKCVQVAVGIWFRVSVTNVGLTLIPSNILLAVVFGV